MAWGGVQYALIGLAPYSFHYDLSKSNSLQFLMLRYCIAFEDLHNFFMPTEVYKKFLRADYFDIKVPLESFDVNNPFLAKTPLRFMTHQNYLGARKSVEGWNDKNFPETRAENIKILDDYLILCAENKIRPIMFLPTVTECYKKYFNRQMLDEFYYLVAQACKKHSAAIFIDGWKLQGLTDADFYDVSHLNIQGAAKFSMFLNQCIEQIDAQGG